MRRAVDEILDRSPQNFASLWRHFAGQCAYCGKQLDAEGRDWHIDHADPRSGNYLGNRVLACATCNSDEKREMNWSDFLGTKAAGPSLIKREATIRSWFLQHARPAPAHSSEVLAKRAEIDEVVVAFARCCRELNHLVRTHATAEKDSG